ncbi:hypothetical protein BGX26_002304 [Mortierella sp. AD094]|nr:hypothetical protein BGX26_002304 [Mortierella sp. AD094]
MLAFDNAILATAAAARKNQDSNNHNNNNNASPLLNTSTSISPTHPSSSSLASSPLYYSASTISSISNHDTTLSLKTHDVAPPVAPPRRSSVGSSRSVTSIGSKVINRTHKPPTISTQPNVPYDGLGTVTSSTSSSGTSSASSVGSGNGRSTPTTPTPRSSVRRKAVAPLPPTPTNIVPPMHISEAKSHYDLPKRDNSTIDRGNCDQDFEVDKTHSIHTNASQGNMHYHYLQQPQVDMQNNSRSSKATDIKRRMSLHNPSGLLKNFGNRNSRNNNASTSLMNSNANNLPPIDHSASCSTLINSGSAMMACSSRSSSIHQESQPQHNNYHPQQQQQQQHQGKGIKGQKLGELLAMGGSLLGSKKRGSEANIKKTISHVPSSTSINSVAKESGSGWPFVKKDGSTSPPNSSRSSLLSRVFGSHNQQNHRHLQQHRHYSQSVYLVPDSHDSAYRGIGPWTAAAIIDDSKIVNWELNKSVPSSDYENEAFALWIRPNIQARTVISGADVENAEKATLNRDHVKNDNEETSFDEELRKKYLPELEDMKVLEEVVDFSIVILMRASASLYPFIASAHSRSIQINIPWKTLQHEEHGCQFFNVRTLKEYQDYIMADIGCAIQAMVEIYDQQERPFSHPDNMGRDIKPQSRSSTMPVILPPNRPWMNRMAAGSHSIITQSSGGLSGGIGGRAPSLRPSVASLASSSATSPTTPTSTITSTSPPKKHRRYASIPGARPSISGMISSIKQSLPSPSSLQSPQQQSRNSPEAYNHPVYASYPDGTPFSSALPSRTMPLSYTQAESMERQQPFTYNFNTGTSGSIAASTTSGSSGGSRGGKFSQSIQNMLNTFRGHSGSTILSSPSYTYNSSSNNNSSNNNNAVSPTTYVALSKQEEKRQQMEHRWRVDILRRKAHLRSWACRRFLDLYNFSLTTPNSSLEEEFKDLYRIIHAIVEVDANANEKSHDILATVMAQAREQESEPFKLRYSQYKTKAPTGKEIRDANKEAIKRFEEEYADKDFEGSTRSRPSNPSAMTSDYDDSASLKLDDCVAPLRPLLHSRECSPDPQSSSFNYYLPSPTADSCYCSAYDCMEFYGLQGHPVWEPLLDRLTKFDTTHHELDARNIFQFLRRMSLYSPGVNDSHHLLSDEARNEMLAVLWVIEKCVRERPDYQQSPTWFRLSSSASAVQAVCNAGGVIPYLKELRKKDTQGRDPILTVHPVTLTGYFKRLLRESGGLLLKETTGLFVELARPATDNGDFWNLEKLSRIDRALLYRVICLDMNRGQVFLRISRVMDQILESSPKDMELDAFALSKMVQVVELSGVLDLKALRRWNGAWSAIILGYM